MKFVDDDDNDDDIVCSYWCYVSLPYGLIINDLRPNIMQYEYSSSQSWTDQTTSHFERT